MAVLCGREINKLCLILWNKSLIEQYQNKGADLKIAKSYFLTYGGLKNA